MYWTLLILQQQVSWWPTQHLSLAVVKETWPAISEGFLKLRSLAILRWTQLSPFSETNTNRKIKSHVHQERLSSYRLLTIDACECLCSTLSIAKFLGNFDKSLNLHATLINQNHAISYQLAKKQRQTRCLCVYLPIFGAREGELWLLQLWTFWISDR